MKDEIINREHKDRLFKFIFGSPEHKEWTLALYNAMNDSSHENADDITFNTIDDVLYMGMKNDVSFLISDTVSVYEHQSTYNPNMPVRMLMYLAKLYETHIKASSLSLHGSTLINLPKPIFVVFYNGTDRVHIPEELSLSDAFKNNDDIESDVSVRVHMKNVNLRAGDDILNRCQPLYEYAWFIAEIRDNEDEYGMPRAVDVALSHMPNNFEIKPLLMRQKVSVVDMLLTEYDEAKDRELLGAEKYREGVRDALRTSVFAMHNLVQKGLITEAEAASGLKLSIAQYQEILSETT